MAQIIGYIEFPAHRPLRVRARLPSPPHPALRQQAQLLTVMRMNRVRVLLFLLLAAATNAWSQSTWQVVTETDSMTDKVRKSATVVNAVGHKLSVYRGPNNAAWVLFALSDSSLDIMSGQRAPMYRIDKREPDDLESSRQLSARNLGVRIYAWEPKWVNFVIWHGKEDEGRSAKLKALMSGQSVVFRYTLATGGSKETTFSLDGAGPAIAEALGISLTTDPENDASQQAIRVEVGNAVKRCQGARTCSDRVMACYRSANSDLKAFQDCMQ